MKTLQKVQKTFSKQIEKFEKEVEKIETNYDHVTTAFRNEMTTFPNNEDDENKLIAQYVLNELISYDYITYEEIITFDDELKSLNKYF